MTLVEHLKELRRRIVVSLLALAVGTVLGFIWYQSSPFGLAPLGEILRGPYCSLPAEQRASFTPSGECRLLATQPFEMFILRLKVGALAGVVLSSPVWLYQIWGFITPGLHKNEKRGTIAFVTLAVTLFVAGAVLAYYIVAFGLEFLISMGDEFQITALTGNEYYNFMLALLVIFGVSFEVPLILVMLNIVGILQYHHVADKRRMIIVGIMIFAAFMTPGGDPMSMMILSAAITILVELAFQFCRINDKRRGVERPEWMDLDDEESSGPIAPSGPIGAEGGIAPAQPVTPAEPIYDNYQQHPQQNFAGFNPPTRPAGNSGNAGNGNNQSPGQQNNANPFDDVL
ncbi:twin-arginine translocase subunit TatC [Corynebacterium ammoniagenes]|uniref:twin-arginine translocase subunit TatC n=1 Tax=Corynebacterium ammoniagenes TaxID=1697 RepID=UPI001F0FF10B|nr:twin-arginine translocase subunit TatC [Corynebacterium ammoniagenes]